MILIYIYTGVRCNELLYLKKENLHLDEQYFEVVKSKTDSGIYKCISKSVLQCHHLYVSKVYRFLHQNTVFLHLLSLSKLYQYSMVQEIVSQNKAKMLDVGSPAKTKGARIPYSDEEIDILWNPLSLSSIQFCISHIFSVANTLLWMISYFLYAAL